MAISEPLALKVGDAPDAMIERSSAIDWLIRFRKVDVGGVFFMASFDLICFIRPFRRWWPIRVYAIGFLRHGSGVRRCCPRIGRRLRFIRSVKRSWALLGSNPTRNNRADGAPQARGPAGEGPQVPFNAAALADAGAMPPKSSLQESARSRPAEKPDEPLIFQHGHKQDVFFSLLAELSFDLRHVNGVVQRPCAGL